MTRRPEPQVGSMSRISGRRPTLKDVAREAGVSPALVSMVLSGRPGPSASTGARILGVADRMGYRPDRAASMLARHRTDLIGVTITPSNPYHGMVVEEIITRAHDRGFEVLLSAMSPRHDYRASLEALVSSRCEALVLLNPQLPEVEFESLVSGIPTVCFGRALQVPHVDVVRGDEKAGMQMLVDHLVDLGHRAIVHVDGGDQALARERCTAYEQAMRGHGLQPTVISGGETLEDGHEAATLLKRVAGTTAVVAFNDLSAIGLMDELRRLGVRVPQDVSVTGIDNSWLAGIDAVSLTTIDPSPLNQARIALDLALERLGGRDGRRVTRVVEPRLVTRGSTARPGRTRG